MKVDGPKTRTRSVIWSHRAECRPLVRILKEGDGEGGRLREGVEMSCSSLRGLFVLEEIVI